MNTHPIHNPTPNMDPYNTRNYRGTTTTEPTITNDPISEITQIIRTLVYYYTENISQHNRVIDTYNQNITTLFTILNNILELYSSRTREQEYHDYNNYYRNLFQSRRGGGTTRNRTASLDLSNLVYLLNIPIQTTTGGGTAAATERPIPLTLTEIAHATRIIYYNESLEERRCPISLDDFIPNEQICQIRGCRHFFKPQHLLRWLESHVECPVCRYDLRQYRASAPPSTPTSTTPTNRTINTENSYNNEVDHGTEQPQRREVLAENIEEQDPHYTTSTIDTSMNPTSEQSRSMRRNISVSEFLPILENILTSSSSSSDSIPSLSTTATNLLNNRFSRVLSDIILEQIPSIDSSNNLLYTIEIPLTR